MLGGEYRFSVDIKGRVSIPAKFRDELGGVVVVTKGVGEKCLFVYTVDGWKEMEEKLSRLPISNKDARQFVRFFSAGACECELDKQGRINVPQYLRDYAGIDKDVVVSGVSTRLEIWDSAAWDEYTAPSNFDSEEMLSHIEALGIL